MSNENERIDTFANRLKKAMEFRKLKSVDLVEKSKLSKQQISQYVNGKFEAKQKALYLLAQALDVSEAWLMGYDVEVSRTSSDIPNIKNIFPLKTKKVPLIGTIAAGVPILADEQFECYVETSDNIRADFCLRVKGDSMINARINDGDIVFIIKQADVDDGEIAAVLIDDEATLKRVYKMPGMVQLVAENPKYKPLLYTENNCDELIILGKAIAFQSDIR